MTDAIVITPVKDSPVTTKLTIEAIAAADGNFNYYIFDDFSKAETKNLLKDARQNFNFQIIHLEDVTNTPSPNYKLVLQMARELALAKQVPLIIVESDVIIKKNTLREMILLENKLPNAGMIGAITTDESGNYNFPYKFEKVKSNEIISTKHSLSFCCTLISYELLQKYDFTTLSSKKDWFDIFISRQSKRLGFTNFLAKGLEVVHLPHSSRPWKNLKYSNPIVYYFQKYIYKRDRI